MHHMELSDTNRLALALCDALLPGMLGELGLFTGPMTRERARALCLQIALIRKWREVNRGDRGKS